jgi:N-acetylglutamate synthase-like GNAT family acetyltransferase
VARQQGEVVGGAIGRTWGECCELQQLWVSAEHRHRGVGGRLLQEFERRAQERGCRLVYLNTFKFQAPLFYKAHGYEVAFEVQGFTHGVVKYTMTRALALK